MHSLEEMAVHFDDSDCCEARMYSEFALELTTLWGPARSYDNWQWRCNAIEIVFITSTSPCSEGSSGCLLSGAVLTGLPSVSAIHEVIKCAANDKHQHDLIVKGFSLKYCILRKPRQSLLVTPATVPPLSTSTGTYARRGTQMSRWTQWGLG